jgi:hypothetical protein
LEDSGGTAYYAHIGGFLAGMILIPFFKKSNVRLFQNKVSNSWVSETSFNLKKEKNNLQKNPFLESFIEKSEREIKKRK